MTRSTSDIVDAEVITQFLREWEPPTPPSSSSNVTSSVFSDCCQPLLTTSSSCLELEEEDQQAILAALDSYNELSPPFVSFELDIFKMPAVISPEDKLTLQRAKATKRRNRHRQRVKEEWQTLRNQEVHLTRRLEGLKRARFDDSANMSQLKWQAQVLKELNARQQAEGQLQRTRMAIERRAAVIQNLQDVLDMQQYAKTTEKTNDIAPEWGPEDVNLYKAFILELAEAYAQTDTIFQQCGLGGKVSSETSFYKPVRRLDAVRNIAFFESTSAFVMPKKYPNSAKAMFDAIRQIHDDHACRKLYEKVENAANTIAVKFGTVNHCEGENIVPLSLIAVQQRFEESDRTVLVWRCLIEGEGDFADMCLDETGWCVLRSTPVDSTDIRTCIRSTPIHRCVEKTIDSKERDEEFANAVVRSSQQDSMKLAQLMDQFLLHT